MLLLGTDCLNPNGPIEINAEELRRIEFREVASLINRAVADRWPVRHGSGTRPLRRSDVCVLIPARTVLGPLITGIRGGRGAVPR